MWLNTTLCGSGSEFVSGSNIQFWLDGELKNFLIVHLILAEKMLSSFWMGVINQINFMSYPTTVATYRNPSSCEVLLNTRQTTFDDGRHLRAIGDSLDFSGGKNYVKIQTKLLFFKGNIWGFTQILAFLEKNPLNSFSYSTKKIWLPL